MSTSKFLRDVGQSIWLDNFTRNILHDRYLGLRWQRFEEACAAIANPHRAICRFALRLREGAHATISPISSALNDGVLPTIIPQNETAPRL